MADTDPTDAAGEEAGDTNIEVEPKAAEEPSAPAEEKGAEAAAAQVELQGLASAISNPEDNKLVGQYFTFESGGKILNVKLSKVSEAPPDDASTTLGALTTRVASGEVQKRKKTEQEVKKERIEFLIPDSTNMWLYVSDSHLTEENKDQTGLKGCLKDCTDDAANKFIAIFVITIQVAAYIAMTYFLKGKNDKEVEAREQSCYGPHCDAKVKYCMAFGTGGLTSILLVGFLWADVVNTAAIMTKNKTWLIASILVLIELLTAIVCGFLVGIYSESDFDAIGGAVGILFVHDLDEKVYASMQVFRETGNATLKKIIAITLWLVISIVVATAVACRYHDDVTDTGALFGTCLTQEFSCWAGGDCIWEGFVCNGVKDCDDGSDEGEFQECDYSKITCPGKDYKNYDAECDTEVNPGCYSDPVPTHFMCESDGACISYDKRCNGVIDCDDGSDEARAQNCQVVVSKLRCDKILNITTLSDGYKQKWSGNFKCNNGQCIDAAYACDGVSDCVDGSDEYPDFDKSRESPWIVACPYAKTVACSSDQILCKLDGRCVSKDSICDGVKDCPDGADERNCDYSCQNGVKNGKKFQCGGNIALVNDTHVVKTFVESSGDHADLHTDLKADVDWDALLNGVVGACVPISWRCDGVYDCPFDSSDEELCSVVGCSDSDYQCTDTGKCVTKSWLCDGVNDCDNGEDETNSVCQQNGINPNSNPCIDQGYFYQCQGGTGCMYSYQMCDGFSDCPRGDDEVEATCIEAWSSATSTTTSFAPGGSGSLTCNGDVSGTTSYSFLSFTVTTGSDAEIKLSTCHDENEGEGSLQMCEANDLYSCVYSEPDGGCTCPYRYWIHGQTSNGLKANTEYVVMYFTYFSGKYKLSMECGSGLSDGITGGASCTASTGSPGGGGGGTGGGGTGFPGGGTGYTGFYGSY